MATLVLTALGTALGGPIGGALGAMVGGRIDGKLMGTRDGPRVKELAVTTSSYGAPIPLHFGRMRAAGTIIWATDLVEHREKSGGKGRPATATYSYSASFAVALSARPIRRVGRIWADGNLLRGAAGDLKVGGALRVHDGHGDQPPDPLLAAALGAQCPAFRGRAYAVFEDLQLADFGNRIPALTFEIIGDEGEVALGDLLGAPNSEQPFAGLAGYALEQGALGGELAAINQLYPLACLSEGGALAVQARIEPANAEAALAPLLGEPAVSGEPEDFGGPAGQRSQRDSGPRAWIESLRYYDPARDYQPGAQRPGGRPGMGAGRRLDLPGVIEAGVARQLVEGAARRAEQDGPVVSWRVAELDPSLAPGRVVRLPDRSGLWRIEEWEWRTPGVELTLSPLSGPRATPVAAGPGDPGAIVAPLDSATGPTLLRAYRLPPQGSTVPGLAIAASSAQAGWRGAALYQVESDALLPVAASGRRRAALGALVSPLPPSPAMLFEAAGEIILQLVSDEFILSSACRAALDTGHNLAAIGAELVQFAQAERAAPGLWRLTGLLRGRGGTEPDSRRGHIVGAPFTLLDEAVTTLLPSESGVAPGRIAAIGLADEAPVICDIEELGTGLLPPAPVHLRLSGSAATGLTLSWVRRARGCWQWPDRVEVPLVEEQERYLVGAGTADRPEAQWLTTQPHLLLAPGSLPAEVQEPLWVRQIGTHGLSQPAFFPDLPLT